MSNSSERWVVKVGSSLVVGNDDGIIKLFIKNLVLQVCKLLEESIQVIIVSSGAVAKGMHELNLNERPDSQLESFNLLVKTRFSSRSFIGMNNFLVCHSIQDFFSFFEGF